MSKALVIKGADFSQNKVTTVIFDGVHTDGITISQNAISASEIGASYQLTATVSPSDSTDPVQWVSSDDNVASVADGVVTIEGCGSCIVSAKSGSRTATCTVTVEIELTGFAVETGLTATAPNESNDIPLYIVGKNPSTGSYNYQNRAATLAVDSTEQRLSSDSRIMSGTGSSATLRPAESRGWGYLNYGWMIPNQLPHNCKKIRVYNLNSNYGSIPLYYKSNVLSDNYENYICHRKPTGWKFNSDADVSNAPWAFAQVTEYDVPDGYDSVNVDWYIPSDSVDGNSPIFKNMSEAQRSAFRVVCC